MVHLMKFVGLLLAALLIAVPAAAQQATPTPLIPTTAPDEFALRTDPASLIGAYYNAISRGDYARAYSYWESAPGNQTQAQFAAGFADTLTARAIVRLPIFQDPGAGNVYAAIPAVVIAERRDGSTQFYSGCFTVHKINAPIGNPPVNDPNWYLQKGELKQVQSPDLAALDTACPAGLEYTLVTDPNLLPNQLDPVALITSYFNLLLTNQSQQAETYWESGVGDLFQPTYDSLLAGAKNVQLYINPDVFTDGAAGSIYASIPALTVITPTNGTPIYIAGCYVGRLADVPVGDATTPDPNWHFYNAELTTVTDVPSAIALMDEGCVPGV
jgi:hypothetical protein